MEFTFHFLKLSTGLGSAMDSKDTPDVRLRRWFKTIAEPMPTGRLSSDMFIVFPGWAFDFALLPEDFWLFVFERVRG